MSGYSIRNFLTPKRNRVLREYTAHVNAKFYKSLTQTKARMRAKNTHYGAEAKKIVRRKNNIYGNKQNKLEIPDWAALAVCTIPRRVNNK